MIFRGPASPQQRLLLRSRPRPSVLEKALQAARRVNDYPTAVRLFEALKVKVETAEQYKQYLEELDPSARSLVSMLPNNFSNKHIFMFDYSNTI